MPRGREEPPLVLTARGRRVLLVLAIVVIALLVLGIRAVFADAAPRAEGESGGGAQGTATVSTDVAQTPAASPTTSGSAAAASTGQPTPSPSVSSTASDGILRSGLVGTGSFTTSTLAAPAVKKTASPRTFVVKVEGGVDADANDIARQVHATLNDKRGWLDYKGASFAAVAAEKDADFVIYLASPPTVNEMCAPLKTGGKWSCASRNRVILNSDRWTLLTPTYAGKTADYRAYMVNHEVGHYLGRGHVGCSTKGAPAPVMLQQSIRLEGCTPNAWPRTPADQG